MAKTILVIEDNPLNRQLLQDVLEFYGYAVHTAEDGGKGLQAAREIHPDLILLDMQMPVLDGFAVAKAVKADPVTAKARIIAITACAMQGDRERILGLGIDEYLSKPIDIRSLPEIVNRLLG